MAASSDKTNSHLVPFPVPEPSSSAGQRPKLARYSAPHVSLPAHQTSNHRINLHIRSLSQPRLLSHRVHHSPVKVAIATSGHQTPIEGSGSVAHRGRRLASCATTMPMPVRNPTCETARLSKRMLPRPSLSVFSAPVPRVK